MSVQDNKVDRTAMIGLEMAAQGSQIPDQRGASRGLSWIRPQMMQQVLSSFSPEKKTAQFPQMELLKLFPESRTPREEETMASSYPSFSNEVADSRSAPGSCSEKQSTAQLIIFYNGAVQAYNVSDDKAQAVLKLANSNASSERATLKPSHGENQQAKKLSAGLQMASKLSLQRFIQKRKDRLGSLNPYKTTSTDDNKRSSRVSVKKEEDTEENQRICLSLSFPSQRSACG